MRSIHVTALAATLILGVAACSGSSHAASPPSVATNTPTTTSTPESSTTSTTALATPTARTGCRGKHAPGQTTNTFMFDRVARSFQLYVPRSYTGARPVPLVFDFHGFGSNAVQQMIYGNFMPLADRDGFLIVAPDGQGSGEARHFNLTGESGAQDDVAMVRALVAYLESRLCIDSFRIYATGMSDGGAMSSVLGCTASDIFAAVAPVAVVVSGANCRGGRPMPIMAFSGTADPIVPYKGGEVKCCGHPHLPSAPSAVAGWVSHDGCHKPHESRVASDVVRRAWTRCLDSSAVVFYVVQGGGHTWPGSIAVPGLGRTTHTIDASALIWQFFSAHTLVG